MESVDLTFGRAFKVWWSYTWRVCVLLIPVLFLMAIVMTSVVHFPRHGEQVNPQHMAGFLEKGFALWLLLMVANVLIQIQAMRWMLKTRWSDFRFAITSE